MSDEVKGPVTAEEIAALLDSVAAKLRVAGPYLYQADAVVELVAERWADRERALAECDRRCAERERRGALGEAVGVIESALPDVLECDSAATWLRLVRDRILRLLDAPGPEEREAAGADPDAGIKAQVRGILEVTRAVGWIAGGGTPLGDCARGAIGWAQCEAQVRALVEAAETMLVWYGGRGGATVCERYVEPCGECKRCRLRAAIDAVKGKR